MLLISIYGIQCINTTNLAPAWLGSPFRPLTTQPSLTHHPFQLIPPPQQALITIIIFFENLGNHTLLIIFFKMMIMFFKIGKPPTPMPL